MIENVKFNKPRRMIRKEIMESVKIKNTRLGVIFVSMR